MKFKVGDRVRCVEEFHWGERLIHLEYDSVHVVKEVSWNNGNISFNGVEYWNVSRFELVEEKEYV